MPIEPTDAIENVQRSLSLVPPALFAILFLAGPTMAWLLYRFVVQPRTRRYAADGSDLLWICERCRSANEVRSSRCYRCAMERDETAGALQVVDGDGIVSLGPLDDDHDPVPPGGVPVMATAARSRPSVAVGPGPAARVDDGPRAPIAVGPGTPKPVVAKRTRKVAAARRADAREPETE